MSSTTNINKTDPLIVIGVAVIVFGLMALGMAIG